MSNLPCQSNFSCPEKLLSCLKSLIFSYLRFQKSDFPSFCREGGQRHVTPCHDEYREALETEDGERRNHRLVYSPQNPSRTRTVSPCRISIPVRRKSSSLRASKPRDSSRIRTLKMPRASSTISSRSTTGAASPMAPHEHVRVSQRICCAVSSVAALPQKGHDHRS